MFRRLCDIPGFRRQIELASDQPVSTTQLDRLAVVAFLHDLGKCNRGFQQKVTDARFARSGHIRELCVFFRSRSHQERLLDAIGFQEAIGTWFGDAESGFRMLIAAFSHHGTPLDTERRPDTHDVSVWEPDAFRDPFADVAMLSETAQRIFPEAFVGHEDRLEATSALQHVFAGMLMLSDWLGSHAEAFFPFDHGPGSRDEFARRAASRAVEVVGVDPGRTRLQTDASASFGALFPRFARTPTPAQEILFREVDSPIVILESETGSGKTEAALAHFYRLFCEGSVDSLYFALPTRVAARELYGRVLEYCMRVFGDGSLPIVLAVPGYVQVDGSSVDLLPDAGAIHDDDAERRVRDRSWSAQRPKRFLAAPVAVGTVDQALLSAIRVRHAHLRGASLNRSLLVVDEVHSSDTYMRTLLRSLIQQHRAVGGRTVLLSATLGAAMRSELLTPLSTQPQLPTLEESLAVPYPAVTTADYVTRGVGRRAECRGRKVVIESRPFLSDPSLMVPEIEIAVRAGAAVLVVLNTVNRAVDLLRRCESEFGIRGALFRCADRICPHHGRFARVDRLLLDEEVSRRFGRERGPGAAVLIGTQTLEQSLDIDADLLITDLSPMDVLLQRIGRLQRHERADRPATYEGARCMVLTPPDGTFEGFFRQDGRVKPQAGIGSVYEDLRMSKLTNDIVGDELEIRIPDDCRSLVEGAVHPENLARLVDGPWQRHKQELVGAEIARMHAGMAAILDRTVPFGDPDMQLASIDERIETRLGLDDRTIAFDRALVSPFGLSLSEMKIPGWMAPGTSSDSPDGPPGQCDDEVTFSYGERRFRYSRYGLERE